MGRVFLYLFFILTVCYYVEIYEKPFCVAENYVLKRSNETLYLNFKAQRSMMQECRDTLKKDK